ncbi:ZmpA/ZmpB/ZmpC family metallo-endopeptidase-related protein, partial [Streptococcus sp. IMAU11618]
MKQTRKAVEKITKYSIRKLSVGVGPVAIGAFFFATSLLGAPSVQADQFTAEATVHMGYVTENELTPEEQAQVIHAIPEEYQNEDTFYLVYRKKTASQSILPQTGTTELAIAGLSLATASFAVLLLSKKHRKKVMGLLLIGSMGQSLLLSIDAAALQNIELASYNQTLSIASSKELANGVIPIEGYDYVGYLRYSASPKLDGQAPVVKVEEKPAISDLYQPTTKEETLSQITPKEGPSFPVVEKPKVEVSTESIPFETVEQADPTIAKGQTTILRAGQNGEQTVLTEVSTVNGHEVRKVVESKVTKEPVSQILAVGTKEDVQPSPQPAPVVTAKGTQEEGHVGEAPVQPEVPAYTGVVEAKGTQEEGHVGEAPVQPENSEYTGVVEAKGTQEEGHVGEAPIQPETPAYTGLVEAKGTQEEGHVGEAPVQPENPTYQVIEGTVTETETVALPYATEYVTDANRYTDEESLLQKGEAGSQEIRRVYKTVNGEKVGEPLSTTTETVKAPVTEKISRGSKAIEGQTEDVSFEEIPFKTVTEQDATLLKGTERVSQAGKNGKKKITKVYKTIKGVKTADAPTVSEEVVEQAQDQIIQKGSKELEKPTLTLTQVDKEELKRSAKATYRLDKPDGVTIKSIQAVLKKGDQVVKTFALSETDLAAALADLDYYKDYTLATTMVYDRGNGDEEEVLKEEPLRLDLKKIEIKNIKETSLISVDDQGLEKDSSLLTETPSDVKPYYLKVTTYDNKVTKLAVDKIEEVTVDGATLYKVTAKAPDLVQRTADNQFNEDYVHYIAKPKAHEGDVYYNFNELVKAMQANPTGTFKIGSNMNAANVQPAGKSYVTNAFKGILESTDGNTFAIHNITRPLFGNIEGGSVKNLLLENVAIDLPGTDRVAPIAGVIKNNATVENVKVTGSVVGNNDVAGIVNKIDGSGKVSNVAFIGKLHATGNKGGYLAGVVGENWKGVVEKAYVDAEITGNKAKAAGLVYSSQNGGNNHTVGKEGVLRNSVAKGSIELKEAVQSGGLLGTNWALGAIEDNITMMKVKTGEMVFGHSDIDADDYFTYSRTKRNYSVEGVSEGKKSFNNSRKIPSISLAEAEQKIEAMGITADKFTS